MINRWAPGCTCCDQCPIMEDDFETGSLDTDKWETLTGSWAVNCTATCQLQGISPHAVIKTVKTKDGYHAVKADVVSANIARLLIHVEDEDNYVAAELDTALGGTIKIFTRSGGTDSEKASNAGPITVQQEWTFCSNDTCYSLYSADGNHVLSWNHSGSVPSGALSAGLATKAGTTVSGYESFEFYEPGVPESDEDCPDCECGCDGCDKFGTDVAPTLTADIEDAWDQIGCPNLTVDASYGLTKTDSCEWTYEVSQANNIVWKITVDVSSSPATLRIDYRHNGSDDFSSFTAAGTTIPDCSEGNFSSTFNGGGNCFAGFGLVSVTG